MKKLLLKKHKNDKINLVIIMNYEYLYKEIPFFKQDDIIEKITDSLSGALVLKITRGNKKYFFKMYHNKDAEIDRIKNICAIYSRFSKICLQVIESGITRDNKVWFVFNWIDGYPLNNLYNQNHDFYKYGYKIGDIYRNINNSIKSDNLNNKFNIQEALDIKKNFNIIYKEEKLFHNNFSKDILNTMNNRFLEFLPIFDEIKKEYIHGDLHPKNIMLDNDGNLVIIDIDSFNYDYLIYNFRYSIGSIYRYDENRLFFKGFIEGRYKDNIPDNINKQLIFILILKFFEQTVAYYKQNRLDIIEDYIKTFNKIFHEIDLSGNTSILDSKIIISN